MASIYYYFLHFYAFTTHTLIVNNSLLLSVNLDCFRYQTMYRKTRILYGDLEVYVVIYVCTCMIVQFHLPVTASVTRDKDLYYLLFDLHVAYNHINPE